MSGFVSHFVFNPCCQPRSLPHSREEISLFESFCIEKLRDRSKGEIEKSKDSRDKPRDKSRNEARLIKRQTERLVNRRTDRQTERHTLFFLKERHFFFEGFMFLFLRLNEAFNVLRAFLIQNTI